MTEENTRDQPHDALLPLRTCLEEVSRREKFESNVLLAEEKSVNAGVKAAGASYWNHKITRGKIGRSDAEELLEAIKSTALKFPS